MKYKKGEKNKQTKNLKGHEKPGKGDADTLETNRGERKVNKIRYVWRMTHIWKQSGNQKDDKEKLKHRIHTTGWITKITLQTTNENEN